MTENEKKALALANEICNDIALGHTDTGEIADDLRAALAARGLEIREIEK